MINFNVLCVYVCCLCVRMLFVCVCMCVLVALGTCKHLHVHDKSLINTVGKLTCQPGTLYKGAMPKGNMYIQ